MKKINKLILSLTIFIIFLSACYFISGFLPLALRIVYSSEADSSFSFCFSNNTKTFAPSGQHEIKMSFFPVQISDASHETLFYTVSGRKYPKIKSLTLEFLTFKILKIKKIEKTQRKILKKIKNGQVSFPLKRFNRKIFYIRIYLSLLAAMIASALFLKYSKGAGFEKTGNITQNLLCCAFIAALFLPFLCNQFLPSGIRNAHIREGRNKNNFPAWSWKNISAFCRGINDYINDNVPLRSFAIKGKLYLNNEAPIPFLMKGKEYPWVFINSHLMRRKNKYMRGDPVASFMGTNLLSPDEMEKLKNKMKIMHSSIKRQNMELFVLIAPSKHTVYPELLPLKLRNFPGKDTVQRQIHRALLECGIKSIYQENELRGHDRLLYYPDDHHWNLLGAYLGFRRMHLVLDPGYSKLLPPLDKLSLAKTRDFMHGSYYGSKRRYLKYQLYPKEIIKPGIYRGSGGMLKKEYRKNPNALLKKKIYILHDSFGFNLFPYIYRFYSEIMAVRTFSYQPLQKDIDKFKPDIVLLVIYSNYVRSLLYMDETMQVDGFKPER